MGKYRCVRCGGEADDWDKVDHAVGLTNGHPCTGDASFKSETEPKAKAAETSTEIPQEEQPKKASAKKKGR